MRVRTTAVMLLMVSCTAGDPVVSETEDDVVGNPCATPVVATLGYTPLRVTPGLATFSPAAHVAIPASMTVTTGNAGNGLATLVVGAGLHLTLCAYEGGATTIHPTSAAQIAAGHHYNLVGCDGGVHAGQSVTANYVILTIETGDNHDASGKTIVTWSIAGADGTPCDDGNACTRSDACVQGVCVGTNPVSCSEEDACHAPGVCDPETGACSNPTAAEGTPCDDGNACTHADTCQAGVCTGDPTMCAAADGCHVAGVCDPASGACSSPSAPDGTTCDEANATATCELGACVLQACDASFADCDGNLADGCETSTTTIANCGGCGIACPSGPNATAVCNPGGCGLSCAGGFADCDGTAADGCEVATASDSNNCGACGVICGDHETCQSGACTAAVCQAGFADCDGTALDGCEVSLANDPQNCGACGHSCGTAACVAGACRVPSTCSADSTMTTCNADPLCTWSGASSTCGCGSTVDEQVLFLMDASGSVTSSGWAAERDFVSGVIASGVSPGSYVGVVRFATTATNVLTFDSDQTRASLESVVEAQPFTQGSSADLDAINAALAQIDAHGKGLPTVIFLVTDGNPNPISTQNPCSSTNASQVTAALQAHNATVVLITFGPDVNPATLSCLYNNDPSRVIAGADVSALTSLRAQVDAFLCR